MATMANLLSEAPDTATHNADFTALSHAYNTAFLESQTRFYLSTAQVNQALPQMYSIISSLAMFPSTS
jgi:hypothetical protein